MKTFPLQILKITEVLFDGEAVAVSAPGSDGEVTVMAKHEALLTSLKKGKVLVKLDDSEEKVFEIEHGFLEATTDKVTILL